MALYIARRLVWTLVVVACVLAITFAVFYLLPAGDPALRFAGKNPTTQSSTRSATGSGLDQPWYVQFVHFVEALLHRRQVRLAGPRLHVRGGSLGAVS